MSSAEVFSAIKLTSRISAGNYDSPRLHTRATGAHGRTPAARINWSHEIRRILAETSAEKHSAARQPFAVLVSRLFEEFIKKNRELPLT